MKLYHKRELSSLNFPEVSGQVIEGPLLNILRHFDRLNVTDLVGNYNL